MFFGNHFWFGDGATFILSASCFSCQDASNKLNVGLKSSYWKFGLRSRSGADPKRSRCISVDPYLRPEHIYGVFITLALVSIKSHCQKKLLVTFNMTWSDLGTLGRVTTGRKIPIQGVKCTYYPMFESVSNEFRPKEAPFNFLPFT